MLDKYTQSSLVYYKHNRDDDTYDTNKLIFFGTTVVNYMTNPKVGGPTLVGCPRPLIRYIQLFVTSRVDYLHPES